MKTSILFISISMAIILTPIGYADDCTWLSAAGDSSWNTTVGNGPPPWSISTRSCKYCDSQEIRSNCVNAGTLSPTSVLKEFNPATGEWEVVASYGTCIQKETVPCASY